ncbi:zinc finger protein 512B isoform X2 [Paramormyrops kingsleyae]|uniref:zinc finger protein 512B isoform X2 n=1 Tax=Paramormyrops kingsleyae TaxID=1676925 RepID=UPI003B96A7B3
METSSGTLGKLTLGTNKGRPVKPPHQPETARTADAADGRHSFACNERAEGKKKGRPRVEIHELRSIPAAMMVQWKEDFKCRSRVKCPSPGCWLEFPSIYGLKYHYQRCQGATLAEKLSHSCPYCEAAFASKVRLQKHKVWNHPERVSQEPKDESKLPKGSAKAAVKKRPAENAAAAPVAKVKKEALQLSQNGACAAPVADRKPHAARQAASSEGGSESDGGSLPPPFPEEDPERTKHRRKQKTPKKFTGEQPSISGTFGLKGINKVEEKLKSGRCKRPDGGAFNEEPVRKTQTLVPKKETSPPCSGSPEVQWQHAISERGEVVCPTCSLVTRKTVLGLRKHMEICQKLQDALRCQQCQKQFRSKAGLNYHTMAEHNSQPSGGEGQAGDEQEERDRLRRVLKQMGRLKCPVQGCSAHFCSLMGYQYHQKRCGKELSEADKPVFKCQHCDKTYRSKAGRDYHLRSEHAATPATSPTLKAEDLPVTRNPGVLGKDARLVRKEERATGETGETQDKQEQEEELNLEEDFERTPSGRVRRRSAQVAVFHLQEIAEDELTKEWGAKRRNKDDLVPDSKRVRSIPDVTPKRRVSQCFISLRRFPPQLNYTRPGLPKFSPRLLDNWKNEVKEKGFICCPNSSCEAVYSSVSGLKAHLANCNKGNGTAGKYRCLLCQKEFSSESGVKYHINKTHSQNWFRAASHETASIKRKEPQNGLKTDPQGGGAGGGKKRGRKPKERPPSTTQKDAEEPVPSETQSLNPTPAASAGGGGKTETFPPVPGDGPHPKRC